MARNLLMLLAESLVTSFISGSCEPAYASWLSQITGIDANVSAGRLDIKPPDLGAIPEMLKHLPEDVGQALLNPVAPALATSIRVSKEEALRRNVAGLPGPVYNDLKGYFPAALLDSVRWTTADGFSIATVLKNFGQEGAVTFDNVVVFSQPELANNTGLWAHELTHVLQYAQLGIDNFAFQYLYAWSELEAQARDNAERVMASIEAVARGDDRTWRVDGTPGVGVTWKQTNTWARKVVPAAQCIHIDRATKTTGNSCPIIVTVQSFICSGVIYPCNEPTCVYPPNSKGPLIEPPWCNIESVIYAFGEK